MLQATAKHNVMGSKWAWEISIHSSTWTGQRPRRTPPVHPWTVWADALRISDQAETPETVDISIRVQKPGLTVRRFKGENDVRLQITHPHVCVKEIRFLTADYFTRGFPAASSWSLVRLSRRLLVRRLSLSLPLLEPLSTWAFHSLNSSNGEQCRNLPDRWTQWVFLSLFLKVSRESVEGNWSNKQVQLPPS